MFSRVALIVLGLLIAVTLSEVFGVSQQIALFVGLVPFALAEAKGLIGPYERSARDLMHDSKSTKDRQ
jgi:hypothetical protein